MAEIAGTRVASRSILPTRRRERPTSVEPWRHFANRGWVRERWPKARRSWIVTDGNVRPLHAAVTEDYLRAADRGINARRSSR